MRDRLEEFIRQNRSSFDDLKAPASAWKKIEASQRQPKPLLKWYAVAASALLLVAVGYIFGMKSQSGPDIAGWEEYKETEKYYEARINVKMEKIKSLPVSEEVLADIKVLDEVYEQLRTQLLNDPNADAEWLLSAMIRHQQQKLEAMEKILDRVEKYNTNEKNDNEIRKM